MGDVRAEGLVLDGGDDGCCEDGCCDPGCCAEGCCLRESRRGGYVGQAWKHHARPFRL